MTKIKLKIKKEAKHGKNLERVLKNIFLNLKEEESVKNYFISP